MTRTAMISANIAYGLPASTLNQRLFILSHLLDKSVSQSVGERENGCHIRRRERRQREGLSDEFGAED